VSNKAVKNCFALLNPLNANVEYTLHITVTRHFLWNEIVTVGSQFRPLKVRMLT